MKGEGISFLNVSKVFRTGNSPESRALDNVTLNISKGEFVGITGSNGSGKSTLVRMINGLILPSEGEVKINGMSTSDYLNIKNIRTQVGMMFQNPDNQIVSPVVEEDIAFGPLNLGIPKSEVKERTDWALNVLDIEEFRYDSPHLLSGGQKQKVAIASALAMKSSYLVLDEPTSMLDNASRNELISILKFLNKSLNITIVLVSHFMEDLVEADRLIVLNKGKICIDEKPWKALIRCQELKESGVGVPGLVQLLNGLRERGHKIDEDIVTFNQVEEFLWSALK
ncbi:MAG: ATP-binding cassette domain-containing protein [Clostridiaceae bacterium]